MTDIMSRAQRSALMSRIRSKDTQPELLVRRLLHRMGYRYLLHDRRLPGTPDLVFPSRRKVVFVHGCFWHGHRCPRGFTPSTHRKFWTDKIAANRARDRRNRRALRGLGWSVIEVFECSIMSGASAALKGRLIRFLDG